MKHAFKWVAPLAFVALFSCQKEMSPDSEALSVADGACAEKTVTLWAGQTINAGSVTISNDATKVYVKVSLNDASVFQNVSENLKLWIGDDLATLPTSNGGCAPVNGQFPWKASVSPDLKEYTFEILFSEISSYLGKAITCESKLFVVLHADLVIGGNDETAYGGDVSATCSRWWYYTEYQAVCCTTPPPPTGYTQTAFAKGGYIFTTDPKSNPDGLPSLRLIRNRWGWAINQASGEVVYNMYAGAGLNYVSKGTLVGKVRITISGSNVSVTYTTDPGFSMAGLHIYAGDTKPMTIAPGQYGYIMSFSPNATTHTANFTLTDSDGDGLWFICHAGVYGNY